MVCGINNLINKLNKRPSFVSFRVGTLWYENVFSIFLDFLKSTDFQKDTITFSKIVPQKCHSGKVLRISIFEAIAVISQFLQTDALYIHCNTPRNQ